ncbi:MAG: HEPN domain-containing protein [Patescibacteria group bacterium]
MKELLKRWVLFAKADLDAAQRLFSSPKPTQWTFILILWHCHQTIEKMLKMMIIAKGKELFKIHDLPRLFEQTEINNLPKEYKIFLYQLNKYYLYSRYPDIVYSKPYPQSNKEKAEKYLKLTLECYLWLKKLVFPKK